MSNNIKESDASNASTVEPAQLKGMSDVSNVAERDVDMTDASDAPTLNKNAVDSVNTITEEAAKVNLENPKPWAHLVNGPGTPQWYGQGLKFDADYEEEEAEMSSDEEDENDNDTSLEVEENENGYKPEVAYFSFDSFSRTYGMMQEISTSILLKEPSDADDDDDDDFVPSV